MLDVLVKIDEEINFGSDTISTITTRGGGAAANTACWMGSVGADVTFAGRIGADAAGAILVDDFQKNNVKLALTRVAERSTGTVVVIVDPSGERTMFPDPGANSGLDFLDLPEFSEFAAIFISGYALYNPESTATIISVVTEANKRSIPVYFDLASVGTMDHFGRQRLLDFLPSIQSLIMNEDEAKYLAQDNPENSYSFFANLVDLSIIKLGARGACAVKRSTSDVFELVSINGSEVDVVDTTGAGDAFAAGFITRFLEGADLVSALESGDFLARQCVGIVGARPR